MAHALSPSGRHVSIPQEDARAGTHGCTCCRRACGPAQWGEARALFWDLTPGCPGCAQEARQLLEQVAWPVDRLHAEVAAMRAEAAAAGEAAAEAGGGRTVAMVDGELDELEHARAGHERGRDDAARRRSRLRCAL